jgi:hypothetical protein
MNLTFLSVILLLETSVVVSFKLRTIKMFIGNNPSDGMNGGSGRGGGAFKVQISQGSFSCQSDRLNTKDNNWEIGEINYFVGRQLGGCEDFTLDETAVNDVELTLKHRGSNGGKIDQIMLWDSMRNLETNFTCIIGQKLDHSTEYKTVCSMSKPSSGIRADHLHLGCNGNIDFCRLPFDKTTFAGAHNAGTGLKEHKVLGISIPDNCLIKNQDLNIKEMLDFGLRFFDFDLNYM